MALALAVAPFVVGASFGNAWVRVLDFAALYIILALGLNIVVGFAGLLDLGYIAFYAVGAYLYALLASPHFGLHWPAWTILPLGAVVAGFFGVVLGAPTLRLRGDYLAIVTLGFGEIIRIFINNLNAPINITNGPKGIARIDALAVAGRPLSKSFEIAGFSFSGLYLYYYLFVILALAIVFVSIRLQDSRIGRAWVAIREDEVAAKACGINTRNIKLLAFAMGASFGGVAGGLFAGFQEFVSPESFGLMESIMVLCMVVLGGMGHIPGVILGGLILAVLPEAFRYGAVPLQQALFGKVLMDPENLRMLMFGLALILVMLYRPAGLWPEPRRRREMAESKA
ncbi:MAG: ABC transporter ATP-binding protein [Rhodocyclaceae bacterium]|nr:ABC transporter ATP-binding protein [Rhodocyclaceae bacterium]